MFENDEALKLPMTHKTATFSRSRMTFNRSSYMSKQIAENILGDIKHNIFVLEGKKWKA